MAPFAEKDDILVAARVWHKHPPRARPKKAKKAPAKARSSAAVPQAAAQESPQPAVRPVKTRRAVAKPVMSMQQTASPPVASPVSEPAAVPSSARVPVPERASARPAPKRNKPQPAAKLTWSPWPHGSEPDTGASGPAGDQAPGPGQRPAWMIAPHPADAPDSRALEVAHDSGFGLRG